ncbi:hypothetical protein PIB30_064285 [Stylosanthes scabra]|uniref:F-box domain-containing protein n=1 Tax=Stylosanthes scabra TaxID=79078 RepID=A0ABU6VJZ5_9FABA|nr:hypothetical protein [Stylosanthes scabra]
MSPNENDLRSHSIPIELIFEILLRLPVKSLLRLRCVSRSWKSLISSPSFVKLHLQRSPKNTNFLLMGINLDPIVVLSYTLQSLMKKAKKIPFFEQSLGFSEDFTHCHRVSGSINGLICLSSIVSFETRYKMYDVRLWNPATRLLSKASPPLLIENKFSVFAMFGFGYDDSTDTYKVVANIVDRREWRNELRVYSRSDTCWRTVSTSPGLLLSWEEPQFVCNSFNWLAVKPSGPIDRKQIHRLEYTYDDYVIFSLDAGEKAQKLLQMPPDLDNYNRQEPKVVVLKEHLCIFCDFEGTHFVVWQMEEFGVEDSWTTLMYVSYLSLQVDACKCSFYNYSNFNMSEDGNYLLMYNERDSLLIVYDKRVKEVSTCINLCKHVWAGVNGYVQSLVSPE